MWQRLSQWKVVLGLLWWPEGHLCLLGWFARPWHSVVGMTLQKGR